MKSIIRNFLFVLKRFATSSILIFLGLTGAMVVFIVCMIQVEYDYNYNRSFERHEDIFMGVINDTKEDRQLEVFNTSIPEKIFDSSIHIEEYTCWYKFTSQLITNDSEKHIEVNQVLVNPGFVNIIKPKVLFGNISQGLQSSKQAFITANTAMKMFGKLDVLGEVLINRNNKNQICTVEAVIEDFPKNSFLSGSEVFSLLEPDVDSEFSYRCLFLLKKEYKNDVLEHCKTIPNFLDDDHKIELINIVDFHRDRNFDNAQVRIISFFVVAILVLLMAYINYVNFSIVISPLRLRSLNIQRVLGMSKNVQRLGLVMESVLFSLLAFFIACILVWLLSKTDLSAIFITSIDVVENTNFIIVTCCFIFVCSLLIGYYPACYSTTFKEVEVLKGGGLLGVNSRKLRSILTIMQVSMACCIPAITLFVHLQYKYVVNYSWGIEKENIVYFDFVKTDQNFENLLYKLRQNSNVVDCTSSRFIPGTVGMSWGRDFMGKHVNFVAWPVLPNFLDFFGIEVVKGENFPSLEDGTERVIFNKAFVDKYFENEDIIGQEVSIFIKNSPVCGVASNVNFSSLHSNVEPMAFVTMINQNKGYIFLKLAKGIDLSETIEWITKEINTSSIEPIEVKFLDEQLDSLYSTEKKQAEMVTIFCVIIILITLMGVYGLINFNVKYREKEIALRKINGANERDILKLLNRDLIIQFIIGFTLSIPMAYYISSSWINQFAYRISLSWWVFALCGFVILLFILITVSVQSYKAAIKNPVESLKSE